MLLGIDFSEKSVAVLLADEAGQTQVALRADLPRIGGASAQWLAAMDVVRQAMLQNHTIASQIKSTCIAFYGPIDAAGVVMKDPRVPGWPGYDLQRALREHLTLTGTIAATPRVVAQAIAEERLGALRPVEDSPVSNGDWLFIHLGAAIGAAARCGATLLRGAGCSAVDIGSVCIERGGALSDNGRRGSLSAYCGGDAFMTRARSYSLTTNSAREIWDMAGTNSMAKSLCDDFVERLAQGTGIALALLNPGRLVIGGELGCELGERLTTPLRGRLGEYCLPRHVEHLVLSTGQLGRDAAVLGATALARDGFTTTPAATS